MPLFEQSFTIVNNTDYTLIMDKHASHKLGDGKWPDTIAPRSTTPSFRQTGGTNVNPTAVYAAQNASPPMSAYLHFYCAGIDPLLHVNMTLDFSNEKVPGSSIAETNTENGRWTTNDTTLEITTTGVGSSKGRAVFNIGG